MSTLLWKRADLDWRDWEENVGSHHLHSFRLVLETSAFLIRQRNPSIPKPVAEVIDHALIDNPSIPFKPTVEFRQALESAL